MVDLERVVWCALFVFFAVRKRKIETLIESIPSWHIDTAIDIGSARRSKTPPTRRKGRSGGSDIFCKAEFFWKLHL